MKNMFLSLSGGFTLFLLSLNTVFWCLILFLFAIVKVLIFPSGLKQKFSQLLAHVGTAWIDVNSFVFQITHKIQWDIEGVEELNDEGSYLVISNHRSWTDIFVLQHIFRHRIPFLKFFLKKELIWVPLLGVAWWALDFPFLKRYSRQFLEKHPERRGKDLETTQKFCEKFKNLPISVMIFLEGTRFDYEKHKIQKSKYRHLLPAKAGGISLVFSSMGEYLSKVLDVTIVYPENEPPMSFWDLLKGKVPAIIVRVKVLPIPENIGGTNFKENKAFRGNIKQWVNRIWQEKDEEIETLINNYTPISSSSNASENRTSSK